ncbi:MAG: c-type cytochrome [Gemmatimonadetes bacterium]|nr:c-type cytochrome [Gemmatimonadota bacterium]
MTARLVRTLASLAIAVTLVACAGGGASGGAGGAPAAAAGPQLPPGVTASMIAMGDSIFNNASCQRCHGKLGAGGQNGPALNTGKFEHGSGSLDDIIKTITTGVPKEAMKDQTRRFPMRARGGVQPALTDDQVKAVAAYVWSLSHAH